LGVDEQLVRAAIRLASNYLLRNVEVVSEAADGDLMAGLICSAIIQANVRPLNNDPKLGKTYGHMDAIPPDELRSPVSVNALAESLGIPYETTRRHVNKLIKLGYCVKVGTRGVIVPSAIIASPTMVKGGLQQYSHLMHFLGQLKDIGFLDQVR
jgi:hypothetical protein